MDSSFGGGVSQAELDAVAAQIPASLILPGQSTVATLPAASLTPRRYMWVTDLFGGPGDYCLSDGTYWKPVRPFTAAQVTAGSISFQTLLNAPTNYITGSLGGLGVVNTLTFSAIGAYPGAKFRTMNAATGLGTLSLVGQLTKALGLNAWADHEYVPGLGWVVTASGGLL